MAAKKLKLKPETINMRGAAVRSLQTAYQHYLDWQRACSEDLSDTDAAPTPDTFLGWAKDELT